MKFKVTGKEIWDKLNFLIPSDTVVILEGEEVKESLAKEETECYTKGYEECKRKALSFLRAMEEEL